MRSLEHISFIVLFAWILRASELDVRSFVRECRLLTSGLVGSISRARFHLLFVSVWRSKVPMMSTAALINENETWWGDSYLRVACKVER